MKYKIASDLHEQSTLRLIGLSLFTYMVYAAHYVKRKTKIINQNYEGEDKISEGFVTFILVISYLSLFLFIGYFFVEETHPIAKLSGLVDGIGNVAFLVWAFKARNRMNLILGVKKPSRDWFYGLPTFLFTVFYFNYKVNVLKEEAEQGASIDSDHLQ